MEGITKQRITSERLATDVLFSGPDDGTPVVFLHGNLSGATWWEETMLALPEGFRGIAPDQRGFGGADRDKLVDATRGLGDLADDFVALLDVLDLEKVHLVGHSMGGAVVWRIMRDYPDRLLTVTQVAPGSPYGFGGTKDADGTPCWDDYAGSGAGIVNAAFAELLAAGDTSMDSPLSPRIALRRLVFKPSFIPEREDEILAAMLATHFHEKAYPGDFSQSPNWPGLVPGVWGVNNALSPKYAGDVERLITAPHKVDVLWIRGSDALAVSDTAAADPGTLGASGLLPHWPGAEVYPPQPMLAQTRAVLDRYGTTIKEVVIEQTGHTPYLENPEAFNRAFHEHLTQI
ncbi:MAG: alpha/beta fold hydrolase [Anaerolineae bacterium]